MTRSPRPLTIYLVYLCLASARLWPQTATPAERALASFEKVSSGSAPARADLADCVEAHTAWLTAIRSDERYLAQSRRGYCALLLAASDNDRRYYATSGIDLAQAIAAWPPRLKESPPDALRVLALIAGIEGGQAVSSYPEMRKEFEAVVTKMSYVVTPVMSAELCELIGGTGRLWIGWAALQSGDLNGAAPVVAGISSPWTEWIEGAGWRQRGKLAEAADRFDRALGAWSGAASNDVRALLGPKPDAGAMHYEAGLARYGARQLDRAIDHFDASIQAGINAPKALKRTSHQLFLRARAKESFGLLQPAATDYSLAVQASKAEDEPVWPVGQARYYRGLILYRLKDFSGAEAEFTAALSDKLGEIPTVEVTAWKALAGATTGGCGPPVELLATAAQVASAGFPKDEAVALVFGCRMKQASTLEQLLGFESIWSERLNAAQKRELHGRIATVYAGKGVEAEDRKDSSAAIDAYRKAIQWDPQNVKARFNLGAIHIDDKKFPLAEAEYRAIVAVDPMDLEAHFWLAESILAQQPDGARHTEACGLLRRSLEIDDAEKRTQFSKALSRSKCAPVN